MSKLTLFVTTNVNPTGQYYFEVTHFKPDFDTLSFDCIERIPTMTGYIEKSKHISFDKSEYDWDCEVVSVNGKLRKEVPNYIKERIV